MMAKISTHVLDTGEGRPAADVSVRLERQDAGGNWQAVASARTDEDGRCSQLLPENETLTSGVYRLVFDTAAYFASRIVDGLYPFVEVVFHVRDGEHNFHIPLLLSPNSYTTYRGS